MNEEMDFEILDYVLFSDTRRDFYDRMDLTRKMLSDRVKEKWGKDGFKRLQFFWKEGYFPHSLIPPDWSGLDSHHFIDLMFLQINITQLYKQLRYIFLDKKYRG